MKKFWIVVFLFLISACSGGGGGGDLPDNEALQVDLIIERGTAQTMSTTEPLLMRTDATNVGTVPVRGAILYYWDGGAPEGTPNASTAYICQKVFPKKVDGQPGGANGYMSIYTGGGFGSDDIHQTPPDRLAMYVAACEAGELDNTAWKFGGDFCDDPAADPELDCNSWTWRILKIPVLGFTSPVARIPAGKSVSYSWGFGQIYPPGTYTPTTGIYSWEGKLYDSASQTLAIQ